MASASVTETAVSAREAEVLAALGEHLTNAEISARLFISVRTVESHVSSLLRKLQVEDRRALAALAVAGRPGPSKALPSPLTPFVGRSAERAELGAALGAHRLVTAVGPGGIGKTRLALAVAGDLRDRFPDGVYYVDLVPVTDAAMIGPAVADAFGLGERLGRSAVDTVVGWLAERSALVVLDNCEHLLDAVVVLLERLLAASAHSAVLATSRARLLVPFERVFPVPGLSVEATEEGPGDAVELFVGRVTAGGSVVDPADRSRIRDVCRALDGMALAIELAAARYPSLGLDGLEAGLSDRLRLLSGGPRVDDRHRSLRSALDWSHALLTDAEQAVLRRVSVFADRFSVAAAVAVLADWPPVPTADVPAILAGLADQSLLIAASESGGTRYRALETVRQYGADRLAEAGEVLQTRFRHVAWCLAESAELVLAVSSGRDGWRATFDLVADELRAALGWAADGMRCRAEARTLAADLARLTFLRGMPGEAQRRYEQAAALADHDLDAADLLRSAAGAAESRHFGNDALRLYRSAAEAALRGGDGAAAATDLALCAERIYRGPGLMATLPPEGEAERLIARGWDLAGDDRGAETRLLVAEAFGADPADRAVDQLTERALILARASHDPLAESAALDALTSIQLARGEVRAAAASALRRTEILAPLPVTARTGFEFFDGFVMAAECAVAAGDLTRARRLSERLRDLPFYREEGHLATSRLLVVTTLAGDLTEGRGLAERFLEGWERAGRPRAGNLSRGAYAAATACGLRGDDAGRSLWLDVVWGLASPGRNLSAIHFDQFFDALLLLHRGRPHEAAARLSARPEELTEWASGMWRPWYAALWAEAAVLVGADDTLDRLQRARESSADNPIATAVVARATALCDGGDRDGLTAAAAALQDAGCRYQWARTLVLLGGADRRVGESALAEMGATPMVWP